MTTETAHRIEELVAQLLALRLSDLGDRATVDGNLQELHAALGEVETFARSIESLLTQAAPARRGPGRPPKVPPATPATRLRPRGRRRGRAKGGVGEFPSTKFILDVVLGAGKDGLRPRDIVAKLKVAAPGHHKQPSALVSTTLRRLRERGKVRKTRGGRWFPAL